MEVEALAARAGVSADWLRDFETSGGTGELTYDRLLTLVRATEPPRPEWWDEGHEHDLHLGPAASVAGSERSSDYWARIQAVRTANRSFGARLTSMGCRGSDGPERGRDRGIDMGF